MKASKEPRRPNLATIVGSGLAVAAAGSLLAFSSLAEQAGLQGLATGGLQPAQPPRGGATHAITVPAPATAPPSDPRDELTRRVREAITRADAEPVTTRVAFEPAERPATDPQPKSKPERPAPIEPTARVEVDEPEPVASDGPPYGHAWGHHKDKDKDKDKSKPAKKHEPKPSASDQPVYARKGNDEPKAKPSKPPKLTKVEKAKPGNGKAKGHAKHSHSKGKGKGHSKHGH